MGNRREGGRPNEGINRQTNTRVKKNLMVVFFATLASAFVSIHSWKLHLNNFSPLKDVVNALLGYCEGKMNYKSI